MGKVYRQWLEKITWTFGPGELKIRKKLMSYVGIGMPIILKYVYNTTKHV